MTARPLLGVLPVHLDDVREVLLAGAARRRPGVDDGVLDLLVRGQPLLELVPVQPLELDVARRRRCRRIARLADAQRRRARDQARRTANSERSQTFIGLYLSSRDRGTSGTMPIEHVRPAAHRGIAAEPSTGWLGGRKSSSADGSTRAIATC